MSDEKQIPKIEDYASILTDVSKFFIYDNGKTFCIIEKDTGHTKFVIDANGKAHPYDEGGRDLLLSLIGPIGIGVTNPPGFTGEFPKHNEDDPAYKLDNPAYVAILGDTSKYFVYFGGHVPCIVEKDTGETKFSFKDGTLAPWEASLTPAPTTPEISPPVVVAPATTPA